MPDKNDIRSIVRQELKRGKREDNVTPLERMSAGYEQSGETFQEAVAAEERRQGRPLDRREQRAVRRSLDNQEGGPR